MNLQELGFSPGEASELGLFVFTAEAGVEILGLNKKEFIHRVYGLQLHGSGLDDLQSKGEIVNLVHGKEEKFGYGSLVQRVRTKKGTEIKLAYEISLDLGLGDEYYRAGLTGIVLLEKILEGRNRTLNDLTRKEGFLVVFKSLEHPDGYKQALFLWQDEEGLVMAPMEMDKLKEATERKIVPGLAFQLEIALH